MNDRRWLAELIVRARVATDVLRDAVREGRVLDFRQRDPLVLAIHNALDELEALLAAGTVALPAPAEPVWTLRWVVACRDAWHRKYDEAVAELARRKAAVPAQTPDSDIGSDIPGGVAS